MEKPSDGEVVKIDRKGRIQLKRERREALLVEFERSTMNGAEFARWAGIKYTTFASWRQKQRRGRKPTGAVPRATAAEPALQWVEAVVAPSAASLTSARSLAVELGCGIRVAIEDARQAHLAGILLREVLSGSKPC